MKFISLIPHRGKVLVFSSDDARKFASKGFDVTLCSERMLRIPKVRVFPLHTRFDANAFDAIISENATKEFCRIVSHDGVILLKSQHTPPYLELLERTEEGIICRPS